VRVLLPCLKVTWWAWCNGPRRGGRRKTACRQRLVHQGEGGREHRTGRGELLESAVSAIRRICARAWSGRAWQGPWDIPVNACLLTGRGPEKPGVRRKKDGWRSRVPEPKSYPATWRPGKGARTPPFLRAATTPGRARWTTSAAKGRPAGVRSHRRDANHPIGGISSTRRRPVLDRPTPSPVEKSDLSELGIS